MISVEEALNKVLDAVSPLGPEKVSILDALGRVLGEDVFAGRAIPSTDNATMDGYAIRTEDSLGASPENPVRLDVIEAISAGAVPAREILQGDAARIMTGAPVPLGADTVVRLEDTRKDGDRVLVFAAALRGRNIRHVGEDVRQGEKVIPRGGIIRPAEVGLLASLGRAFVLVHQRPLVAIVATGNELAEIDEAPGEGKIVNSNSYAIAALVRECGAVPLQIGIARDSRKDLIAKFQAALRADLIVSTGGVSVGDYDLVKDIMKEAGNRMHFWQVAMKPGRPLAFGAVGAIPAVGLPGNFSSSMICFEQFVRPAILKMLGHANLFRRTVRARLGKRIEKQRGIRQFIRVLIRRDGDGYAVVTDDDDSGMLISIARANGLVILPEAATAVGPGELVTVLLIDDSLEMGPVPES